MYGFLSLWSWNPGRYFGEKVRRRGGRDVRSFYCLWVGELLWNGGVLDTPQSKIKDF